MRVVGLDLSLSSTGIALVEGSGMVHLNRVQSKPTGNTVEDRSLRLRSLAGTIHDLADVDPDLVLVESPTYSSKVTGSQHDRSGLWWMVVGRLTGHRIPVVEVAVSTLKTYALGKGSGKGTDKDQVLAAVVRRYLDIDVDGNDKADALVLAAMGARHLGHPVDTLPDTHTRALKAVKWPAHLPALEPPHA